MVAGILYSCTVHRCDALLWMQTDGFELWRIRASRGELKSGKLLLKKGVQVLEDLAWRPVGEASIELSSGEIWVR